MYRFAFAMLAIMVSQCAVAVNCDPNVMSALQQAAANGMQQEINFSKQEADKTAQTPISQASCLDKYKSMQIGSILGLPNLSLAGLLASLENKACSTIDAGISAASQPLSKTVVLPGGGGTVSTAPQVTYGGNANQQPVTIQSTGQPSAVGGVLNKFNGLFQ